MKRYSASISYEIDIVADEDNPIIQSNLEALGARNVSVVYKQWTGAGEHEFVGSNAPGLEDRQICIKCMKLRPDAGETCGGIPIAAAGRRK